MAESLGVSPSEAAMEEQAGLSWASKSVQKGLSSGTCITAEVLSRRKVADLFSNLRTT